MDELGELRSAYRERRYSVCPECGGPTDDMAEGDESVPVIIDGGDGDTYFDPELVCDCGWAGFKWECDLKKK